MPIQYILKQRKYPFVLALSVLLVTVAFFVLTTNTNPISNVLFYSSQIVRNNTVSRTVADPPLALENEKNATPDNNNNTPSTAENTTPDNNNNTPSKETTLEDNKNNENNPPIIENTNPEATDNTNPENNNNPAIEKTNPEAIENTNPENNKNNDNPPIETTNPEAVDNTNPEANQDNNKNDNPPNTENSNPDNSNPNPDNNQPSDAENINPDDNNDNTQSNADDNNNGPSDTEPDNNNNSNVEDETSNSNTKKDKYDIGWSETDVDPEQWKLCNRPKAADYIPCLDNDKVIKRLPTRRHMEHRERHCPNPPPRCLVPLPDGYKRGLPWPKSRDMVRYNNVPYPKLVDYKKEQNWIRQSGEYFVFPGGGTQFRDGATQYLDFIQRKFSSINWGKDIRVVLDVGSGVASFGGYLLDKGAITMSFAPKDEHEAQIQFALERGIPAILSVIGTQKLPFPDDSYDLIHCARCRVHWDGDGGKPLLELNRILRPGGFFVWSATPVYKKDERHRDIWRSMYNLTESICWKKVARGVDKKVGFVIFQKPATFSCYKKRKVNEPPLCNFKSAYNSTWNQPLERCISELPLDRADHVVNWPKPWPERLRIPGVTYEKREMRHIEVDSQRWLGLVGKIYTFLPIDWPKVRNVMDMNAAYGGFAAALIDKPVWVMNVMPVDGKDSLPSIFDRGLIGIYHDWCESFSTYPRTYDLLHCSNLLTRISKRCDLKDVIVEIDRIVRPEGYFVVQDSIEMMNKVASILRSLHWSVKLHQNQFLIGIKGFWRP